MNEGENLHGDEFVTSQPFKVALASTTDPDKKQMMERLDAAVSAALLPLQAAAEGKAAHEVVQPLAEVRLPLYV